MFLHIILLILPSTFIAGIIAALQLIQFVMNSQGDIQRRQSKRKIFLDESYKSRLQEHSLDSSVLSKRVSQSHVPQHGEQLKKQIQQLKQRVKSQQAELELEREKYDQLFEEYEELIEKNNLIEKEYINLKYQHNKEIKNLKKNFKEKTEEEIKMNVQDFLSKISGQNLWESIKQKIDKFIQNLRRISEIFMQKSKRHHDSNSTDVISKLKSNYKVDLSKLEQKIQKVQTYQRQEKIQLSPQIESFKENDIVNSSNQYKQVVFEDEYYGDIDDYQHYEQKIIQRLNYQLMKNCNRSSSDARRKKIFNKKIAFQ